MMKLAVALSLLCSCAVRVDAPSVDVDTRALDFAEYCDIASAVQVPGEGFGFFADTACGSNPVYLEMATDVGGLSQSRCAQFVTGEVLCLDPDSMIEAAVYTWEAGCTKAPPGAGPWFVWRSCGVYPTP